jgi:DNA-binding MarR family transcriptional regulator
VDEDSWTTATAVLRLASQLVEGIQRGLAERGFDDVRPTHGFAFARLSEAPATAGQLAEYLGITKQATSELVQHLVDHGYLERVPDPSDRRARLLVLTERGHSCTRAAQEAATATVHGWTDRISAAQLVDLQRALVTLTDQGRLRPPW